MHTRMSLGCYVEPLLVGLRLLSDIAHRAQCKSVPRFAGGVTAARTTTLSHCFAVNVCRTTARLPSEHHLLRPRCIATVKGERMEQQSATMASKILEVVRAHPGCGIDDLVERLSDVQWSDVFVEVDRLSRSGELRITKANSGFLVMLHAVS